MMTYETFVRNRVFFGRNRSHSGNIRKVPGIFGERAATLRLKSSRDDGGCGRTYPFQQKFQGLF